MLYSIARDILFLLFCYTRLKAQIPDIKKSLDIVAHLQTKKVGRNKCDFVLNPLPDDKF